MRWFRDQVVWFDAQGRRRVGGWTAGPHIYIVHGAPNPAHDGIWQLTPLNMSGNHAVSFNATHWGWEIVGDYDRAPWSAPLAGLVEGAAAAALHWRGLSASAINGHRDDPKTTKTCPGAAINLDQVRLRVTGRLHVLREAPPAATGETIRLDAPYTEHSPILGAPRATLAQAIAFVLSRRRSGDYTAWDIGGVILPAYWEQAVELGIDPVLAVAQMCHETGYLSSALSQRRDRHGTDLRNPAGIGVTGAVSPVRADGFPWDADRGQYRACLSFADWKRESIPAHLGRLLAYALPESAPLSFTQDATIRYALQRRTLPAWARGSAPTLKPLGTGHNPANIGRPESEWVGWAKMGWEYGRNIAAIAEAIRKHSV